MKKKILNNILSLTWGLPLTIIGAIVALILLICGKKPKTYGHCVYFAFGGNWGGISLGRFIFVGTPSERPDMLNHEYGHTFQNCWWGPLFLFVIGLPSLIRCQYRNYIYKKNYEKYKTLPAYDDIWFEGQATRLGNEYIEYYK